MPTLPLPRSAARAPSLRPRVAERAGHESLHAALRPRQEAMYPIPTLYGQPGNGPAPGIVVAIVLGAIAGFLLLFILLTQVLGMGSRDVIRGEEEIVVRRSRSPRSRRSRHSTRTTEVREVSRSPHRPRRSSVPPQPTRIVEERIHRTTDRRVEGDDVVEVFEETSDVDPPPRRKHSRRSNGYRSVDPHLYAGGDYPQRRVSSGSRSRRDP